MVGRGSTEKEWKQGNWFVDICINPDKIWGWFNHSIIDKSTKESALSDSSARCSGSFTCSVLQAFAHILSHILSLTQSFIFFVALLLLSFQPRYQFLQGAFPDPRFKISYAVASYILLIMELIFFSFCIIAHLCSTLDCKLLEDRPVGISLH